MRHVNNAVYFSYLEEARFAYWQEVLAVPMAAQRSFILARAECDFKAPATMGDRLEVRVRVASIGRSSFTFEYEIADAPTGRLVVSARTVQVMYDYDAQRPTPMPDEVRAAIEQYEGRSLGHP